MVLQPHKTSLLLHKTPKNFLIISTSMKKALFLLIILSVAFTTAYGQKKKKPVDNGSKPIAGNIGLSFRLTGISNTGFNSFNVNSFSKNNELLVRYYVTPKIAFRGSFGVQTQNDKFYSKEDTTYIFESISKPAQSGIGVAVSTTIDSSVKSSGFSFAPGIEYHLGSSPKLDPYVGGQIGLGYVGATTARYVYTSSDFFTGGNGFTGETIAETKMDLTSVTPGGFQFGLSLLSGFNYFFSDHIAIGAEYSIGFGSARIGGESTVKGTMSESGLLIADDVTSLFIPYSADKVEQKRTVRNNTGGLDTRSTGGIILSVFF